MITSKHGGHRPVTTRSNKKGQAIGGIWVSQGIIIYQGGYLPFNDGPKSDHRLLWINISYKIAFGKTKPHIGPWQQED